MNAREWFKVSLVAEESSFRSTTTAERQRHAREALDALFVAASLGHPDAFLNLGIAYQHGSPGLLPKRLDVAEHWIRKAVKVDPSKMLSLATLLMEGGRKAEGRKWLRKALSLGDGSAACHLAREMEGTNPSRALRLYLKGVALGDPFAALCAGNLLEAQGSLKELLKAETLYKVAVRRKLRDSDQDLERIRGKLKSMGLRRPSVEKRRRRPPPKRA